MANRTIIIPRYPAVEPNTFTRINVIDNGDGTVSYFTQESTGNYPSTESQVSALGSPLRALLSGSITPAQGGAAVVSTAGEGYLLVPTVNFISNSAALNPLAAINQVRFYQIVVPWKIVVGRIISEVVAAGGAGTRYGLGIYSAAGARLLQTGPIAADAIAVNNAALVAPVTLDPGVYLYAYTADSTTVTFRSYSLPAGVNGLINATSVKLGQAANAGAAGVLPATLGALTVNSHNPPFAVLEA